MLDLSIIIVNFNAKDFLRECIDSILNCVPKKINYEIIVVDNASGDNSCEMIKKEFPQVKLIANKVNVGFSKSNNQGIKVSQGSKYVLFLNPDTVMQKNTLERMISFMDTHKNAGAATCKLVMPNGKLDDAAHRGFPTPWNSFSHFSGLEKIFSRSKLFTGYSLGWMDLNSTHEIDALAGAFMLVRREAGEQAEWWDEDYFFYGEDIDFCYILKQKGWKIYYVSNVFIIHYKGVSGGIKKISKEITTADTETKKRATYWRFKAMRIFYRKHYEQKYPQIINFLVNIGISLREKFA
jgi:GT2 family glycosyltransferase